MYVDADVPVPARRRMRNVVDNAKIRSEAGSLSAYCRRSLASLPRSDQRRWGEIYVRGLVTVPGRKSIRRIAEHVVGQRVDQGLQQFVNQSPWDERAVLRRYRATLAREPGRARSAFGAARAAELAGDRDAATSGYQAFLRLMAKADQGRADVAIAKASMGAGDHQR